MLQEQIGATTLSILERRWLGENGERITLNPRMLRTGRLPAGEPLYVEIAPSVRDVIGVVDPRHPERFRGRPFVD